MADVVIRRRMDSESLALLSTMLPAAVSRALRNAVSRIDAYGKSITPVRTGRLRDSFKSQILSPTLITMIWHATDPMTGTKYASIADEGAKRHMITPRGSYPLKWPNRSGFQQKTKRGYVPSRDGFIRAWRVDHPGYFGNFFSEQMRIVAPQIVREEIVRELQGLNQ